MRWTVLFLAGLAFSAAVPMANAADLPPAPVLDDNDDTIGSGWYLRGDIGAVDQLMTRQARDGGSAAVPPLVRARFDRDLVLGGGIGYQLGPWFRTDLTIDHRFNATYKGTRFGATSYGFDRADFEATTVLLNGYVDLPLVSGITPYIGAGIGVSRNRFDEAERALSTSTTALPLAARTETVFAWALMGGLAIDITGNLKLDLGYRYSHLGSGRTQLENDDPPLRAKSISAHEFRVGARYVFN